MERLIYRSTSLTGLQADVRREDLLDDARRHRPFLGDRPRERRTPFGLRLRLR